MASISLSAEENATLQPADMSHENISDCTNGKYRSCCAASIQIQVSFWGLILILRGEALTLTFMHRELKKNKNPC